MRGSLTISSARRVGLAVSFFSTAHGYGAALCNSSYTARFSHYSFKLWRHVYLPVRVTANWGDDRITRAKPPLKRASWRQSRLKFLYMRGLKTHPLDLPLAQFYGDRQ